MALERCFAIAILIFAVLIQQCGYLVTYSVRAMSFGNFTAYKVYETVRYDLIRLLQTLEFAILIVSVYQNRKGIRIKEACTFWCHFCGYSLDGQHDHHSCTKKKAAAVALFVIASLLAIALTLLGCVNIFYMDQDDMSKIILSAMIQVFKFFNLLTECVMWLFVIALVLINVSEWDTCQIKRLPCTASPDHNTLVYFQNYYRKGHDTEPTRKALQGWFVLQYLVYLLYIYSDIIHIVRPYFSGRGYTSLLAIIHHAVFIAYDLAGFVLPYLLALWMIEAHRNYHTEMTRKHLFIEDLLKYIIVERKNEPTERKTVPKIIAEEVKGTRITVEEGAVMEITPEGGVTQKKATEEIVLEEEVVHTLETIPPAETEETTQSSENGLRVKRESAVVAPLEEIMAEEIEVYIAKVITMKIEVCTEFDFSPQILDISVPLNSPGYSMSVLIALFALIASFVP